MSVPKLLNVVLILLLLLMLYSILGVSLFSTSHLSETLNVHGNFQNFVNGFITLFRASTGEAWNEIMHDLGKTEADYFSSGSWCSPDHLFDTEAKYEVLRSKCLTERPNACIQTLWGWNALPAIYWVTYTLLISIMVMNLVIAVILESYEDGKATPEAEALEYVIKVWERYDPNRTMYLPLPQAMCLVSEVLESVAPESDIVKDKVLGDLKLEEDGSVTGWDLSELPMKYVTVLATAQIVQPGDLVDFHCAAKMALRLSCVSNTEGLKEVDEAPLDAKSRAKLARKEKVKDSRIREDLMVRLAVIKLQKGWRLRKKLQHEKERQEEERLKQQPPSPPAAG